MKKVIVAATVIWLLVGLCLIPCANGQTPNVKKLLVEGAPIDSVNVPITVSFDGAAPANGIQVIDPKTKKEYPATIRDGALVFVVDALPENAKLELEVSPAKESKAPKVAIAKKGEEPQLDIVVNGEKFTAYQYSNDNRKPFLWPVYCEGDATITRDWPMDQNAPEKQAGGKDHIHHKSIWTSFGDINGVDCWGEDTKEAGYQHSDEVTFGSGDAFGWIHAKNTWQSKEHKPVIAEEREYRFYDSPAGARTFDEKVTFTASYGKAVFGDTKEGGIMAFRIRPEIEAEKGGTITLATGEVGEKDCWGKKSPWCDYFGSIEGVGVRGIAVFDNPSNLRYPTNWHVRGYGLNGANCFGLSYFTDKKENGEFELDEGKSLTFNYRVVIHSGDSKESKIVNRYGDYVTPPKATWIK
jgi:hypothetical protein